MTHLVVWPKKNIFQPFGNTTAVNLTRDFPPELKSADILLLGDGKLESLLYTVYADSFTDRSYEFTHCNAEGAVLARNVVVLALLLGYNGEMDISLVWNIHFHFFFDKASSDVLTAECRELVSASKSIEGWKNSKYGGVFQVCDERTLQDMREYWISYANFDGLSQKKKKGIWDSFSSAMQQGARRLSTGAPWQAPLTTITTVLHRFWSSGTIFKDDSEQRASANQLNPTFLYNSGKGDKFNLHYSINPLSSFYLDHIAVSGKVGRTYQVEDFVDSARKQFQDWCSALSGRLRDNRQEKPGLVIRLFVGEVLQFCHAYHNLASPSKIPAFASKWTWSPINLTNLDGMGFDIIDACGLSHTLGLANILVAASPLLKSFPVSTLYTDSLRENVSFESLFHQDTPTLSLLLGICPVPHASGFKTDLQSIPFVEEHGIQTRSRIPWRSLSTAGGPQLTFDNNDLAFLIRRIYLDLFAEHEDVFVAKERAVQGRTTTPHYTRATLSELLRIVHTRMVADHWQTFINRVVDLISMEQSLIVGRNFFQDFCLHLVMRNLIEFSSWDMAPDMGLHKWKNSLCRTWTSVPPVIVLVVKFPRRKISVLEGLPIEEMCIPEVQCAIEGLPPRPWHNYFTDLQFAFGDVIKDSTQPHFVKIKEDPMGWNGKSDLIMALYMPSWSIKSHPTSFKISLCVYNTPVTARMLQHRLGVNLSICDIRGSDSNRVFVCPEMPGVERHVNVASSGKMPESNCSIASVELSKSKVSSIAVRSSCANEPSRTELSSGAKVSMEQHSPTAIAVTIGSTQMILPFPYFVDIDQVKLRIARKSLYIEAEAPVDVNRRNRFPVMHEQREFVFPWSMPYVYLDRCLSLRIDAQAKEWKNSILSMFAPQDIKRATGVDGFSDFRASLASILQQATGLGDSKRKLFQVRTPDNDTRLLFYVTSVLWDQDCHSIVLDSHVIVSTDISECASPDEVFQIEVGEDEAWLWKQATVAFVERCRAWQHRLDCEKVTLLRSGRLEFCLCDEGVNTIPQEIKQKWPHLSGSSIKRTALGPLFLASGENTIEAADPSKCAACKKAGDLMVCSRCKSIRYCSAACQRAHWKTHKKNCA